MGSFSVIGLGLCQCEYIIKPGLQVTFFPLFFSPFKNGLNEFLWCCLHMTLKYIKKIKAAADKHSAKNGTCKRSLRVFIPGIVTRGSI